MRGGSVESRFWSKVQKTDDCWLWRATRFPKGYGQIKIKGRRRLAHRVAWELTNGPIPDGLQVCHHCDNPPCVRPDHLFLGTQSDNIQDAVSKGRMPFNLKRPPIPEVCRKCGGPMTKLARNKRGCRSCSNLVHRVWREANREAANTKQRAWISANRERLNAYRRTQYAARRARADQSKTA